MASWLRSYRSLNSNVKIVVWLVFWWISTRELWESRQLPTYIFMLNHDNTTVGYASTISGMIQLMLSIPAGYYTDKWRRDTMLQISSVCGLLAILMLSWAVDVDSMTLLYVSMGFWGASQALNDSPMESMFADSTPTGNRGKIFAVKHVVEQVGRTVGGVASAALFVHLGNQWSLPSLRFIIITGLLLGLFPNFYQLFLSDDASLKRSSEAAYLLAPGQDEVVQEDPNADSLAPLPARSMPINPAVPRRMRNRRLSDVHDTLLNLPIREFPDFVAVSGPELSVLVRVPYVVALTDLLTAFGSGGTIQFFPIYFYQVMQLDPLQVSLLFALSPIINGIFAMSGQKIASHIGRATTVFIVHLSGAVMLFLLSLADNIILSVVIFLCQCALISSIKPLKRSILMDTVPKSQRGTWNAIESFTKVSWAGSAVIGGVIADMYGFRILFMVCAGLYVISAMPVIYLFMMDVDHLVTEACSSH